MLTKARKNQKKMLSAPNGKISKPIVINLENVNVNQHNIDDKIRDKVPKLKGVFVYRSKESDRRFNFLLDSGASFSCISEDLYLQLKNDFRNFKLSPSVRDTPISASGSQMAIIGDCTMGVKFYTVLKWLLIENVKFSVIRNLSQEAILGIEVLKMVGFQVIRNSLQIGHLTIPRVEMSKYEVNLAVEGFKPCWNQGVEGTIISARLGDEDLKELPTGDYLMTPTFLNSKSEFESSFSKNENLLESCIVNISELRKGIDYILEDCQIQKLPQEIDVSLEKVVKVSNLNNISSIPNYLGEGKQKKQQSINSEEIIAKLIGKSNLQNEGKLILRKILNDYIHVFSKNDNDIGEYTEETVKLRLRDPSDVPPFQKPRRIPYALRGWLKSKLGELEKAGIIMEISGSPYNSPIHLVRKTNGSYRITVDLRRVNDKIKCTPRLGDLLDKLVGSKYFSSIDFTHGFWNLKLDNESMPLTAFSALNTQYQMTRMPMGIKVGPSAFQNVMFKIAGDLTKDYVTVYLDDLLIHTPDMKTHFRIVKEVLRRFGSKGFKFNPNKCEFLRTELDYLGYTVNADGWKPKLSSIKSIIDFPRPSNKKDVRSFCGMIAFYSQAIPGLQYKLGPLHEVSGTKSTFNWKEEQENAFSEVKDLLGKSVTLAYPSQNEEHRLFLTTDASEHGWGISLSQRFEDNIERPLGFGSGTFREAQTRWPIRDKELYALVKGLEQFHVHLYLRRWTWRTDNQALKYLVSSDFTTVTAGRSSAKVIRWLDFIFSHQFDIEHLPGTSSEMLPADCLSRNPQTTEETTEEETTLMNFEELKCAKPKLPFWTSNPLTLAEMISLQQNDKDMMKQGGDWRPIMTNKRNKRIYEDGLLYIKSVPHGKRLAIPKAAITRLMEYEHLPNHLGHNRMYKSMSRKYVFPKMYKEVLKFVKACELCITFKVQKKPKNASIRTTTSVHPMACLQCDLVGPLPITLKGNQYILTVICELTRWTELRAIPNKSAEAVATALIDIFMTKGPPLCLLTDNGREFCNAQLKSLLSQCGIKLQHGVPLRPQTQGKVERCNQKIGQALKMLQSDPLEWDNDLPAIQLGINLEVNRMTGHSPFVAIHGWALQRPMFIPQQFDIEKCLTNFSAEQWVRQLVVRMNHAIADTYIREEKTKSTPIKDEQFEELPINANCLVYFPQPVGESKKFYQAWKGKFRVIRKIGKNTYEVCSTDHPKKSFLCHRERLRLLPAYGRQPTDFQTHTAREKEEIKDNNDDLEVATGKNRRVPRVDYTKFY